MSERRAIGWVVALGVVALVYVVSVAVTGDFTANGPWVLLVIVALGFAGDAVLIAIAAGGEDNE